MTTPNDLVLLTEDWPAVVGRPALTQGVYGQHGNLELVCCAADYGLLVGWFNADTTETHTGAAVGCWSGALRFGGRERYVSATITQVSHGPHFLEVLATTESGELHRHVWSPDPGFVDHGPIATQVHAHSGLVEMGAGALVAAVATEQECVLLRGEPDSSYPQLPFLSHPLGAPASLIDVDCVRHEDHHDVLMTFDAGPVALACDSSYAVVAQGMQAARIARDGARAAVLYRTGGRATVHDLAADVRHDLGIAADGALTLSTIDRQHHCEVSATWPPTSSTCLSPMRRAWSRPDSPRPNSRCCGRQWRCRRVRPARRHTTADRFLASTSYRRWATRPWPPAYPPPAPANSSCSPPAGVATSPRRLR